MSKRELQGEIEDLKKRILILTEANELLTEKAEDIYLLGIISEKIGLENTEQDVIDISMESISTLKDIAYCAFITINADSIKIIDDYGPRLLSSQKGKTFVPKNEIKTMLDEKEFFFEIPGDRSLPEFIPHLADNSQPNSFYLKPIVVRESMRGALLCLNCFGDSDYLRRLIPLLDRSVDLIEARLDTLSFLSEIQEWNKSLESKVNERTNELSLTNIQLEQEIADRQKAEEALIVSEEKFHSIFKEARDGIVLIDSETGFIVECNPEFERQTGRSRDKLKQMKIWEIRPLEKMDAAKIKFNEIRDKGTGGSGELDIQNPDGKIVPVEFTSKVISIIGKKFTQSICRDITERKKAEDMLAHESEVNAAMAELSRLIISSSSINKISFLVLEFAKRFTTSKFGYAGYIALKTGHLVVPTLTRDIWDVCKVEDKKIVFEEFRGLFGWVLNERKTLMTNNAQEDSRSTGTPEGIPIKKFLSAPALIDEDLAGQVAVANADNDYTDKEQTIIERLAALYSIAVQRYRSEDKIREYAETLEQKVKDRTKELQEKNRDLEHFNKLFMDREFRIKELRDKVKELEGQ